MSVRRAHSSEWPVVRDVRLRALADAPGAFASTLAREEEFGPDEWRARVSGAAWFLAWVGSDVAGVVCGLAESSAERHLVGMWVEPGHRGTTVGSELVAAMLAWAGDEGATSMSLWVVDGNARARRFYERLGFLPTGERQPLPSDPSVGEERMTRSIRRVVGA